MQTLMFFLSLILLAAAGCPPSAPAPAQESGREISLADSLRAGIMDKLAVLDSLEHKLDTGFAAYPYSPWYLEKKSEITQFRAKFMGMLLAVELREMAGEE